MKHGVRGDPVADEWVRFRELTVAGRSAEVLPLADRIAAETGDPRRRAQAHIERLAAFYNMGHTDALASQLDEVDELLRQTRDPRLHGEFHVLAAAVAGERGAHDMALLHLVHAERELRRMDELTLGAVDAWNDLAAVYTQLGYHAEALTAAGQCRRLCAQAGIAPAEAACVITYVGAAVHLDQRGDTAGCVEGLTALIGYSSHFTGDLPVMQRVPLRYAVKRLAALGHRVRLDVPEDTGVDAILADVNVLAEVCDAIAARQPDQALSLLDQTPNAIDALGVAEPLRLRSMALTQRGDHAAALDAERNAIRALSIEERQLRTLFHSGASARLDQDRLRRMAAHYASQASTDPLTGLPNRRRIDELAAELTRRGVDAVIGILDLDGFKAVNDTYGHNSGDVVLQRVAGVLARTIRQGDLVARLGGDEFVVILPRTTLAEAEQTGRRMSRALAAEDWTSIVPDTPVSATVGWARLTNDPVQSLAAADDALYRTRRRRGADRLNGGGAQA
ncbi:hypothetical protein Cs7R123_04260 [Catellatospora sp. TT07R-123]|uniref:GGDEF domain-containing protein n=1 Tax=Catellatospora sp. TT07R-123 TaxID=2733863 RepID=UPI001B2C3EFA|nr:diguanylate cyclase [Catellatospora sp. TT07R-123]GHJ43084.1 hypothetical protein Cs7R123_04260 [Catellatospora sp. TT07R-123]